MRWPWQSKHTFRSGLLRIIEGLENGSVALARGRESVPNLMAATSSDLVRTFPIFLDKLDTFVRKMRRLEIELGLTALGMWLAGVGLVIVGPIWSFWPVSILGVLFFLASIWPIRLVREWRCHRIRNELLVAILRATPKEERPWQLMSKEKESNPDPYWI